MLCRNCESKIPNWCAIDGIRHNLQRRKYCLRCSPFGAHNTRPIGEHNTRSNLALQYRKCPTCGAPLKKASMKHCSRACDLVSRSQINSSKTGIFPLGSPRYTNILDYKISRKYANAKREGHQFLLTKEQIEWLLAEAGIEPEDWSFYGYHLARYNDSGDYVLGNCRFIPASDNFKEKKISDKQLEALRRNRSLGPTG